MRTATILGRISTSTKRPRWKVLRERQVTADQLIRHFEIVQPPVDVRTIAERLGVEVTYLEDDPGWSGAVQVTPPHYAQIWIAGDEPRARQRFTLAHELGHLLLHDLDDEPYRDFTFSGSREEREANEFAADLLMPLWMIDAEVSAHGPDIRLLAYRFDVSEPDMKARLQKFVRR